LPIGKLSEPADDLVLKLSPAPDQNLASFELLVGDKSVFRQTGPEHSLRLPRAAMRPGTLVRWKLDHSGQKHEGQFTVEPKLRYEAWVQSLPSQENSDSDHVARSLLLAATLTQEGYGWDARELIRKALSGS
jgi:hypothetical protein